MGCWNETCAVSGLAIQEGDDCVKIKFNPNAMETIAYCGVHEWKEILNSVESIEFGKYDDYGGIDGSHEDGGEDNHTFILKHFWDYAKGHHYTQESWLKENAEKEFVREITIFNKVEESENLGLQEIIQELKEAVGGYIVYQRYGEDIYKELNYVMSLMVTLRRSFYTADYRGCQSDMDDFKSFHKEVNSYLTGVQ